MKKLLFFLFLNLIILGPIFAHPANKITFKLSDNQLQVTIFHKVASPTDHYINKVKVLLNGKLLIQQNFLIQLDDKIQNAVYFIPGLKKGDILELIATCNKFGDKTEKIVIE